MLDASIPLSGQVMQLDDPLERQAKVASLSQMAMQNRYMQSKMDAEGRTANLSNMRGQAYMDYGNDPAALRKALLANRDPEGLIAHDKSQLEAQKAQGELASQKAGLGDKLIGLRAKAAQFGYTGATPQHAAQTAQLLDQSGDTEGAQSIRSAIEKGAMNTPEQVKAFFQPHLAASQTPGDLLNPKYQDVGGQLVDMNPNTKAAAINKTQTPESLASNELTRRRQNMVDARSREANSVNAAGKAPSGYRYTADGQTLEPIPGGPATGKQNSTEDERKAAGIAVRMESALKLVNDITRKNAGSAKPELIPSLVGKASSIAGNAITSPDVQRVQAAQRDSLDAALTLATGAAYTKEQLDGLAKSYYPQIGDSPSVIADKKTRLDEIIQTARARSGRSEHLVDEIRGKSKQSPSTGGFDAAKEARYQEWKKSQGR